ncbi:MAG: Ig-like domain-containing protein [Calditrichaceae bacterium]
MVTKILYIIAIILIISFVACDDLGTLLDDYKPEISGGVKVSKSQAYPLDTVNCSVNANNPVDGELTYAWKNTGGRFIYPTNQASIKWIAPNQTGNITITVEVTNTEGTSDASKKIEVLQAQPPVIQGEIILSSQTVAATDTIIASISATNPRSGSLTYKWTCNYGTLINPIDTTSVKWIAPESGGTAKLNVEVSNDLASTTTSIEIEVLEPQEPVLNGSIVVSAESVTALDTVLAHISATNPRSGPLAYDWSCSNGRFLYPVDRDTIKWIAPLAGGECTLTVEVSNDLRSVQTSKKINVVSSEEPIVHIITPENNSEHYLGDQINIAAEAQHINGISFVYLYVRTPGSIDSLIQTLDGNATGKYNFVLETMNYKDLVGYSTIRIEAEAANQLQTKGSDQISIYVLGIHIGKDGQE